jgi:uncharacterized membrane protein YdbT with pleckstrin-like domain
MDNLLHLNDGEQLIFECRPQDSLVYYSMYSGVMSLLVPVIIFSILTFFSVSLSSQTVSSQDSALIHKMFVDGMMFLCFYLVILYMINIVALGQYRYVFTNQRCIISSGLVGKNKRIIPYNRIADVKIQQSTVEALMGLSSVFIDEQAMNISRVAWIKGLAMEDAEQITKIVSQHITSEQA